MLFWRVPDEFYDYLNRDGKRLGLSGGYHKRGKVLKHLQEYAKIRRDYIETVAKELYNQNRIRETTLSLKQNELLRGPPVSSHYANIEFVEDKYSKLPIHYYTAVKQGIIDPEVKKAIFSRDVNRLRNIQNIPRDVYDIFRSAGLKGYSEKITTPTRNKNKMADTNTVTNYNTNRETGEENYINNNYSKHVNAEESYKEGTRNNAALVSSSDFSSSVNSSDNVNSTDSSNASQDGSIVGLSNTENMNNDNSKTDEFDKKRTSDDATSARNNQAITKESSDNDIPESKTNYKSNSDTADTANDEIVTTGSSKKPDINNEDISKNTDIDFYGDVTTSNIKSTISLFDASTDVYDIFSKQNTTDSVTDNYENVADETTIEKTNAFDDFNDAVLTYGYEGRLNDFGTSIETTLSPDTYNNSDVSVTDAINNIEDTTTTTTTTVNDGETTYDFDKLVTTTSSYLNVDSVDSFTPDDMATDSTDVSGYILSDTDFNDAFIWSSTTKPYLDSNNVNGKYDGVVETEKEFGNNSTDSDAKDVSTTTTTYSDTTNTDDITSDNAAIDITNENNISSDIIATDTFDSNVNDTNSLNATETASSVTSSANDSSSDNMVIDVTNANGNVSDSLGTEYINSSSNSSDTADTKTESSITNSSADFASGNTATNMDDALINSTETTETNGFESNFVDSDSAVNTSETYSTSNSTIDVSADDAGKDLADVYENTSTNTVTDSSSDSIASDASIATTTVSTITNNDEFSSDDTAININDTFSDSANTEISGSDSSVKDSESVSLIDLSTTYSMNNTADASAPDDIATQFSNSTDTVANNDTDNNINDAGTMATTPSLNTNSEDSLTPDKWIDRENALNNLTGIAATNDFYSNYEVNDTLPATETTVSVSNSSDASTSDNMAIDAANEDKNLSDSAAINSSDNNFDGSDTTVLLPVKNSMNSSTDDFASDNEALDEVNKYNNSSDSVVVNSSDSNFDETGLLVPTATTYSINNNADNFVSDAVTIDEANVNNNSSDSTSTSSDSNFEQSDTTILLPTTYSVTNSADNLDSNNIKADIDNESDNSSDVKNINGVEDNSNDSNTLNSTETPIGNVSDDSSDTLGIITNNSTETPTALTYSYFDNSSNDTVTELTNSNTDGSTDTSTAAVNESVNSVTEAFVSTATESNIGTDISTATVPETISSGNKDDNLNSETVTIPDSATSSVAGTTDIKDAGSSGTINDSNSIIPKNDHESSTDKGLEAENREGSNGTEGDKNNTGQSVIVQSQSKIEKKKVEKKEIEGIESKSDEDVIITSKSTSVETPVLTNVDSIRMDSGSYSVEKF